MPGKFKTDKVICRGRFTLKKVCITCWGCLLSCWLSRYSPAWIWDILTQKSKKKSDDVKITLFASPLCLSRNGFMELALFTNNFFEFYLWIFKFTYQGCAEGWDKRQPSHLLLAPHLSHLLLAPNLKSLARHTWFLGPLAKCIQVISLLHVGRQIHSKSLHFLHFYKPDNLST